MSDGPMDGCYDFSVEFMIRGYHGCTVQLKGNLTHADRAYTTYWLKAHSIGVCEKENLPTLILKGKNEGYKGIHVGIYWFHSCNVYVQTT